MSIRARCASREIIVGSFLEQHNKIYDYYLQNLKTNQVSKVKVNVQPI